MNAIRSTTHDSPLGTLTLAADEPGRHLIGLWEQGQEHWPTALLEAATPDDDAPVFATARAWLDRYFAGEHPDPDDIPLAPRGTPFQRGVWDVLRRIPSGRVTTYGAIARRITAERASGAAASPRAVGAAVGRNPISIIVPCHRVVGADGSLTGYAGGLDRKIALLALEGVAVAELDRRVSGERG